MMELAEGKIQVKDVLRGQQLTVALPSDEDFGSLRKYRWKDGDPPAGGPDLHTDIKDKLEGYLKDVLDKAAEYGGYNYTIMVAAPINGSSLDWLNSEGVKYDIIGGGWTDKLKRRRAGYVWPYLAFDYSLRLVTLTQKQEVPLWETMLTFSNAFTGGLWATIIGAAVFTALILWLIESSEVAKAKGTETELAKSPSGLVQSVWLSGLQFTGGGGYSPVTFWGRLLHLSFTFLVLIVISSYTANLATSLIVKSMTTTTLVDIENARRKRATICAAMKYSPGAVLKTLSGGTLGFQDTTELDERSIRELMLDGTCDGYVAEQAVVDLMLVSADFNEGCIFATVGPALNSNGGGFAVPTTQPCSQIMVSGLSYILRALADAGVVEEAYTKMTEAMRTLANECQGPVESSDDSDSTLNITSMAGVLLGHAVLTIVSLIGWTITRSWHMVSKTDPVGAPKLHGGAAIVESKPDPVEAPKLDGGPAIVEMTEQIQDQSPICETPRLNESDQAIEMTVRDKAIVSLLAEAITQLQTSSTRSAPPAVTADTTTV